MEYYDNAGGALARLLWSSPHTPKAVVPPTTCSNRATAHRPLFHRDHLTGPAHTRTDRTVNFNWGNGFGDPNVGADLFSVRWTGRVTPPFSETYRFYANTDDGARLWVNNVLLVDNWTDHGPTETSGTITLTAGVRYDITMEYYEQAGGALVQLLWSSPSLPKQIVPAERLTPGPDPQHHRSSEPSRRPVHQVRRCAGRRDAAGAPAWRVSRLRARRCAAWGSSRWVGGAEPAAALVAGL